MKMFFVLYCLINSMGSDYQVYYSFEESNFGCSFCMGKVFFFSFSIMKF